MTTPRIVSLTALAASLLIVIFTITQANSLTLQPDMAVAANNCFDLMADAAQDCPYEGPRAFTGNLNR